MRQSDPTPASATVAPRDALKRNAVFFQVLTSLCGIPFELIFESFGHKGIIPRKKLSAKKCETYISISSGCRFVGCLAKPPAAAYWCIMPPLFHSPKDSPGPVGLNPKEH